VATGRRAQRASSWRRREWGLSMRREYHRRFGGAPRPGRIAGWPAHSNCPTRDHRLCRRLPWFGASGRWAGRSTRLGDRVAQAGATCQRRRGDVRFAWWRDPPERGGEVSAGGAARSTVSPGGEAPRGEAGWPRRRRPGYFGYELGARRETARAKAGTVPFMPEPFGLAVDGRRRPQAPAGASPFEDFLEGSASASRAAGGRASPREPWVLGTSQPMLERGPTCPRGASSITSAPATSTVRTSRASSASATGATQEFYRRLQTNPAPMGAPIRVRRVLSPERFISRAAKP
jgi:hypothetical protein